MDKRPEPPDHLADPTRHWFNEVVDAFELEPHHVRLLILAAESWDRHVQARKAIDRHGLTYEDANGLPKTRPEVAIERDSRLHFARMLRELSLDAIEPPETPRPPPLSHNRGN